MLNQQSNLVRGAIVCVEKLCTGSGAGIASVYTTS
jgi:hypothetical protein